MSHRPHEAGIETTEAILLRRASQPDNEKYTAIVSMNDNVAIGVIRCLVDHGVRVPEDISVVGFDDLDIAAVSVPRLTTVNQPKEEMAKAAFDLLSRQIEHGAISESKKLKAKLLIRESTARAVISPPERCSRAAMLHDGAVQAEKTIRKKTLQ